MTGRSGGGARRAAAVVAVVGAVGTAVMAVAHAGVEVPLVSALGPGGNRPVWPAAIAFGAAAGLYAVVAAGLRRARRWADPAAGALFAVTLVGALVPFRGAGSVVGAVIAACGLALLAIARRGGEPGVA